MGKLSGRKEDRWRISYLSARKNCRVMPPHEILTRALKLVCSIFLVLFTLKVSSRPDISHTSSIIIFIYCSRQSPSAWRNFLFQPDNRGPRIKVSQFLPFKLISSFKCSFRCSQRARDGEQSFQITRGRKIYGSHRFESESKTEAPSCRV